MNNSFWAVVKDDEVLISLPENAEEIVTEMDDENKFQNWISDGLTSPDSIWGQYPDKLRDTAEWKEDIERRFREAKDKWEGK